MVMAGVNYCTWCSLLTLHATVQIKPLCGNRPCFKATSLVQRTTKLDVSSLSIHVSPREADDWMSTSNHRSQRRRPLQTFNELSSPVHDEGCTLLRFHRSPFVVRTVESTPTGSKPQVGPSTEWSIVIRCSPCILCFQQQNTRNKT